MVHSKRNGPTCELKMPKLSKGKNTKIKDLTGGKESNIAYWYNGEETAESRNHE